ncbi:MAG: hypothetical protein ACOC8D_03175, partial [bacterium]
APATAPAPGQMAQAQQTASSAAQSASGTTAAQAAGQMAAMAAQASAQANAMGGNMHNQPQPRGGGDPTKGTGAQDADLSEAKVKNLGIKLEDWARLPGELRNQILQAAQDAGPDSYRPLIKRYFQEVARRGSIQKPEDQSK